MRNLSLPGCLLLLWSVLVLVAFVLEVQLPVADFQLPASLQVLGAGLISLYAIAFLGYRIRTARRLGQVVPRAEDPLESSLLEWAYGVMLVVWIVTLAGVIGLLATPLAWGIAVICLVGPHRAFARSLRERWTQLRGGGGQPFLWAALGTAGVLSLVQSLAPVTAQDALVYHLAIPDHYVREGGIGRIEGNFFAQFPQNIEMLFTVGLLVDTPELSQWFHWLFALGSGAAVAALARRLAPRASGLLAATLFFTVPSVVLIAGGAYIDLAVVFFVTLSLVCFLRWRSTRSGAWLVTAAVLAGFATGSKYTAGFQGVLLVLGALVVGRREWRLAALGWGPAMLVAVLVGVVASPWWIKNIIETGNPLYPFCYGLFGGEGWDAERAQVLSMAFAEWGGPRDWLSTALLPWRLTMSGELCSFEGFDGILGCAFLMALPILLYGLRLSVEHRIVGSFLLAWFAFWVLTTRQMRFLLPGVACAAALLGATMPVVLQSGWHSKAFKRVIKASIAVNVFVVVLHFVHHNPFGVVLGVESERAYLCRAIPGGDYPVFEYIERELPEDSYLFFGSLGNPGFLCKRPYYADAFFENHTLLELLRRSDSSDDLWREFRERGFTHFLFRLENVFDPIDESEETGRRSGLTRVQQSLLQDFLNRHGKLVARAGGTLLYELGLGAGPLSSTGGEPPAASS